MSEGLWKIFVIFSLLFFSILVLAYGRRAPKALPERGITEELSEALHFEIPHWDSSCATGSVMESSINQTDDSYKLASFYFH